MKRNLLFDMDGTLVDSQYAILNSLHEALRENDVKCGQTSLAIEFIGPPIEEIVSKMDSSIPKEHIQSIVASFRRLYDAAPERGLHPYPELEKTLSCLQEKGMRLYVVTNKPWRPTAKILETLGWAQFKAVMTPDAGSPVKRRSKAESIVELLRQELLLPEETVMIGDTLGDIHAAHEAGVAAMAVQWGYEKNKDVLCAEADCTAASPQELLSLLSMEF